MHPKTPQALSGTPQSRTAKRKGNGNIGCTRVTGRELAGIAASTKQPMAIANINKQHFLLAGSCAVVLSVFSRSSVGKIGEGKEKIERREILIKSIYSANTPNFIQIGGRAYTRELVAVECHPFR